MVANLLIYYSGIGENTPMSDRLLGLTITIDPIEVGEILLNMEDIQKEIQSPFGFYIEQTN